VADGPERDLRLPPGKLAGVRVWGLCARNRSRWYRERLMVTVALRSGRTDTRGGFRTSPYLAFYPPACNLQYLSEAQSLSAVPSGYLMAPRTTGRPPGRAGSSRSPCARPGTT